MKTVIKYLKFWHYFLISILVCIGFALAYVLIARPVYHITTTLLVEEDKKGDGMLKETAFSDLNMFHTTRSVDNEMQILHSLNLLTRVFKKLDLQTKYYVPGTVLRKELYGRNLPVKVIVNRISPEAFLDERKINIINDSTFQIISEEGAASRHYHFGETIDQPEYSIKVIKGPAFNLDEKNITIGFVNINSLAQAYSNGKLDIQPVVKDANTIVVSLDDPIPQRGLDILNTLIDFYNKDDIENKNKLALSTIQFIDNRLKFLGDDLSAVEENVERYKQNNMVTDVNADAQANLQQSEEYKQELQKVNVQLSVVESMQSYFNNGGDQGTLVPSTLGLQDSTLPYLVNKFNDLQQEYQRLLKENEPGNPLVINAKDQLNNLKQSIVENLKNIKRGLLLNRNNLAGNSGQYESKIKTAPVIEKGLLERNRQQAVKAALYAYLVQKREETALSLSATIPDARIVSSPNVDPGPSSPKKPLIFLCAFIFGGLIPLSFIEGKEVFNKKIRNLGDLKSLTNVRILGELSHSDNKKTLVIDRGSRTNISELFRYIRMNLSNSVINNKNKVFMVTSSTQGEGKTFMSINLGATLAVVNKKVIVLEFDLRKPDLLKNMNLNYPVGITDYLHSDVELSDIIKPSKVSPNMYVISSGKLTQDPAEDLLNPKLEIFFNTLREMFDYIIIDTSPIGLVADAFSFERFIDSTIYVVRYNYTKKDQINTIEDILKHNKLKNPMIVLNDAKAENLKSYGYASKGYAYTN